MFSYCLADHVLDGSPKSQRRRFTYYRTEQNSMAENSLVFDLAEALYLQARISKQSDYWTISRLSPKPVSFTNTTFECHRLGGRVNWSEILKNLVRLSWSKLISAEYDFAN